MIFPENMPRLAIQEEEEGGHSTATPMKLPQAPPPKVKPRTQPRRRVSSPEPGEIKSEETESPKPAKRPIPVPRSASKEKAGDGGGEQSEDKGKSSTPEVQPQTASPSRAKKPVRTSLHDDSTPPVSSSPVPPTKKPKPVPPKPSPRTNTPVQDPAPLGDPLEGLKRKDPAELTVKEKMMLAQQAMAKQAEYKSKGMAPPVRKKMVPLPKSSSIDVSDSPTRQKRGSKVEDEDKKGEDEPDGPGTMERSKSMEELDEVTPKKQPRKLPPGAFNIGIPMGLPGEMRHRSYTVASGTSTDSNEHTQSTEEQPAQPENEETNDDPEISRSDTQISDKSQPSPQTTPGTTPKKSPMTTPIHSGNAESSPEISKKLPSSSSADNLDYSEDELDGPSPEIDQEEMLRGASHNTSSATPDFENVLFWSSEVVGMWLGNIGLGSHAGAFKEKGVKGYLLFDLDNNKLKVSRFFL